MAGHGGEAAAGVGVARPVGALHLGQALDSGGGPSPSLEGAVPADDEVLKRGAGGRGARALGEPPAVLAPAAGPKARARPSTGTHATRARPSCRGEARCIGDSSRLTRPWRPLVPEA